MAVSKDGDLSNLLLTPDEIAGEALMRLIHNLLIARLANHSYEKNFGDKIGDTLTVKRPYYADVSEGRVLTDDQIADLSDRSVTINLDRRIKGALRHTDKDLTLNIVNFGDRYLNSLMESMAYKYDEAGGAELATASHYHTGKPGEPMSIQTGQYIRAHADDVAIPNNSRNYGLMYPLDIAELGLEVKDLYMPKLSVPSVEQKYHGRLGEFSLFSTTNLPNYTVNSTGTGAPVVNGASQTGEAITVNGLVATADTVMFRKGQLITFAGVHEVKPRGDHKQTGRLKTFTITRDVVASGAVAATDDVVLPISPELNDGTMTTTNDAGATVSLAAYQNVSATPADNAAVNLVGTAGNTYRQAVFFERDFLEYVNVQLYPPAGLVNTGSMTDPQTGMGVTLTSDSEVKTMVTIRRLDTFFGVKAIYPELAIRSITDEINADRYS